MDYNEVIRIRCSSRKYTEQKVESFKLAQILEAGRIAPTGCNRQPFKILVCDNEDSLAKINKAANIYGAPLALLVCIDPDEAWVRSYDDRNIAETDAAIVTTQMMLSAANQQLGSVWICRFEPDVLRKEFSIPDNLIPVNILAIGYAAEEAASAARFDEKRKPIAELVFYNNFER